MRPLLLLRLSRRHAAAVAVTALAVGMAACSDPYEQDRRERATNPPSATPTATATAPATRTAPAATPTPSPRHRADAPGATPEATVREFAERWSNWSWRDADSQQRRVAALATGEFRDYLLEQDLQPLDRNTLERTKPSFSGRVEAVSLKPGRGSRRAAYVIVREQEYANGEPKIDGLHYTVYAAELARVSGGWAVSKWEGQP